MRPQRFACPPRRLLACWPLLILGACAGGGETETIVEQDGLAADTASMDAPAADTLGAAVDGAAFDTVDLDASGSKGGDGAGQDTIPPADAANGPFPAVTAWGPATGPGGPAVAFTEEQLFVNCAFLDGGEHDESDHHNLVVPYDGFTLAPWAPEWGGGGITLFDLSDPCNPSTAGVGSSVAMRETHSIGFHQTDDGRRWAVTSQADFQRSKFEAGIMFWDLTDTLQPTPGAELRLPDVMYPDSYARITMSTFWQAPYVYVGSSDNGVHIVDASDPTAPVLVATHQFDPVMRVGQVQAIGNMLVVTATKGPRTVLLDISDPASPQPIPGGDFIVAEHTLEVPVESYFTNFASGFVFYARKTAGGGLLIYDVRDPTAPVRTGSIRTDGNGGYVSVKDQFAFVGMSDRAHIFDISDHADIREHAILDMPGDLDTPTPVGNVVVLSVDDGGDPDKGSAIAPWRKAIDTEPPHVTWSWPGGGAEGLAVTSRFGLTFNEMVEPLSAFEGSVRLYRAGGDPDEGRVPAYVSAQELIVNVWPKAPLEPDTAYTLEVPAGGVVDQNGNAVAEPFAITVRTAP